MAAGSDVNMRGKDGLTPLHIAVRYGHLEVCELLLVAGSDVEEREPGSLFTHLHWAVVHNHVGIIQLLISHKADVNSMDQMEFTPLRHASQYGHLAAVGTLLQANADPLLPDNFGYLPIHMAACGNKSEAVKILVEKGGCSPD